MKGRERLTVHSTLLSKYELHGADRLIHHEGKTGREEGERKRVEREQRWELGKSGENRRGERRRVMGKRGQIKQTGSRKSVTSVSR